MDMGTASRRLMVYNIIIDPQEICCEAGSHNNGRKRLTGYTWLYSMVSVTLY